jgi:hypothetical protein
LALVTAQVLRLANLQELCEHDRLARTAMRDGGSQATRQAKGPTHAADGITRSVTSIPFPGLPDPNLPETMRTGRDNGGVRVMCAGLNWR